MAGRVIPGDDVLAAWLIGGLGFAGPVVLVAVLNRRAQVWWRWFWSVVTVAAPLVTLVVAVSLGHPPPPRP